MASFNREEVLANDLDFRLMSNTFVTLFWRPSLLDEATTWLANHGYEVVQVDASGWSTESDLHRDIAAALHFPDYYGRNLDALNDCMRDIEPAEESTGFVLVFTGYDRFADSCPYDAQVVLDIFASHARHAALFGQRMICLVQSDDPDIEFKPVGAEPVMWNNTEWLVAKRHPEQRTRAPRPRPS